METAYIFTDGSSNPRTKEGGWAFCLTDNPNGKAELHKASGYAYNTTNNRMELSSVINSLHYVYANVPTAKKVLIHSDSRYVSDPIYFDWISEWKSNNWIKSDGAETKNYDLWDELLTLLNKFKFRKIQVDVIWVRGHNGNHFNEICDKLAKNGRYKQKINRTYEGL